jgi:hypothetical protein
MDAKQLLDLVDRYQQNREFIKNEESTKMARLVSGSRTVGSGP